MEEEEVVEERTPTTDIIVGVAMILLSVVCGLAYTLILYAMARDKEMMRMNSYKFMFMLGIFDVLQCFPHAITGVQTIYQTTWSYAFAKAMGVIATPSYVGYSVMTVVLSFNRFIQLLSTDLDALLFSRLWCCVGLFFWLLFAAALASPMASIIYFPEAYSWDYDDNMPWSRHVVQRTEMYIEIGGIFVSAIFYAFVVVLLYLKKKRFQASKNYYAELKILIQASVITIYCTVLNVFWHNYQVLLPASIWAYMGLNFMWIFNSGIYPVIYVIVNRALRDKLKRRKNGGVTMVGTASAFPTKSTIVPIHSPLTANTAQSTPKQSKKSRFFGAFKKERPAVVGHSAKILFVT